MDDKIVNQVLKANFVNQLSTMGLPTFKIRACLN